MAQHHQPGPDEAPKRDALVRRVASDPRAPAIAEEKILKLITALCFYADARQYAIDAEGYCPILGDGGNTAADALREFDADVAE